MANPPDVVFLVTVTSSENWVAWTSGCWYCYWGWWPGWGYYPPGWGPGWGWGYPPSGGVASYETGTLFVDMVGWRFAFVFLAAGPLIGVLAMWRLRVSPAAGRLAGGRG